KPWEMACITVCGPLMNSLFALLFYILYTIYTSEYILVFSLLNGWILRCIHSYRLYKVYKIATRTSCTSEYILVFSLLNGWMALANFVPYKINNKKSDGYVFFNIL